MKAPLFWLHMIGILAETVGDNFLYIDGSKSMFTWRPPSEWLSDVLSVGNSESETGASIPISKGKAAHLAGKERKRQAREIQKQKDKCRSIWKRTLLRWKTNLKSLNYNFQHLYLMKKPSQ